jgi:hypothetical protein
MSHRNQKALDSLTIDVRTEGQLPVPQQPLVAEALGVRVNRVRRDAEVSGESEFGAVIEYAADDLRLGWSEAQAASNC